MSTIRRTAVTPDGIRFRDLDGDGVMAPYEDARLSAEERVADLLPRLSIEERYPSFLSYYYKVTQAVNDFVSEGFVLPEDAGAMTNRMLNAGVATGAIKMAVEDED